MFRNFQILDFKFYFGSEFLKKIPGGKFPIVGLSGQTKSKFNNKLM